MECFFPSRLKRLSLPLILSNHLITYCIFFAVLYISDVFFWLQWHKDKFIPSSSLFSLFVIYLKTRFQIVIYLLTNWLNFLVKNLRTRLNWKKANFSILVSLFASEATFLPFIYSFNLSFLFFFSLFMHRPVCLSKLAPPTKSMLVSIHNNVQPTGFSRSKPQYLWESNRVDWLNFILKGKISKFIEFE